MSAMPRSGGQGIPTSRRTILLLLDMSFSNCPLFATAMLPHRRKKGEPKCEYLQKSRIETINAL
jgi:hypothetical protein